MIFCKGVEKRIGVQIDATIDKGNAVEQAESDGI